MSKLTGEYRCPYSEDACTHPSYCVESTTRASRTACKSYFPPRLVRDPPKDNELLIDIGRVNQMRQEAMGLVGEFLGNPELKAYTMEVKFDGYVQYSFTTSARSEFEAMTMVSKFMTLVVDELETRSARKED